MTKCAWCDDEAATSIVLEPTRYRTVTKTDPQTGEKLRAQEVAQFEIRADVCERHRDVTDRPAGQPVPDPRRRKAEGFEQSSIFDVLGGDDGGGPKDAIRGLDAA